MPVLKVAAEHTHMIIMWKQYSQLSIRNQEAKQVMTHVSVPTTSSNTRLGVRSVDIMQNHSAP